MKEQYIYGRKPILEALKNESVDKLYVLTGNREGSIKQIFGKAKDLKIVVQQVDREKLDSMAQGGNHQGVVALVTDYKYATVEEILEHAKSLNQDPFVVVLDGIEDTHNLGAIARSAESAGAHGIIIPKRRSAMVNETVYKASAGAVEYIKIAQVTNISQELEKLKKQGLWVYGAHMEGEIYYKSNLKGAIALVIGNEGKGISPGVKKHCDHFIKIPQVGKIESLNASCAATLLLFEILRQRNEQ